MGITSKVSSLVRSTIRRIEQRLWRERPRNYANVPVVYKYVVRPNPVCWIPPGIGSNYVREFRACVERNSNRD